ncbi:hypothetical protein [Pelotalea chapellei]|uniref:Glycosyltransferase involved in cell wall biosynthesis n=1 Tax=Pelotalea chapellei TaxID=44671 RepID=A0ABS5U5F0_9BACT|nr:hypothetical protein [Pelotalea chapellei]MBT1070885.1 hypothetical protein [Pelotalea chapellei]
MNCLLVETNSESIKVGFGPITHMNSFHQSGEKVSAVMAQDSRFATGHFKGEPFNLEELQQFDVLIFIKYYPSHEILRELKRQGKKLILDYQDMFLYPSVYELNPFKKVLKRIYYFTHETKIRRQLALFDLCFVASPVLDHIVAEAGIKPFFLQRQLYNDSNEFKFQEHDRPKDAPIIYWTGVTANQTQNAPILPILKRLKEQYGCRIVFSSDSIGTENFIEYRLWDRNTWEDELAEVDIAFRWRDTSNMQRCKDANKVMAYMGAALPVVIYPTESEKLVVKDGDTGFFTYTPEQFEKTMINLVKSLELRKKNGLAAHQDVWSQYSLKHHVEEIKRAILLLTVDE